MFVYVLLGEIEKTGSDCIELSCLLSLLSCGCGVGVKVGAVAFLEIKERFGSVVFIMEREIVV